MQKCKVEFLPASGEDLKRIEDWYCVQFELMPSRQGG